MTEANSVAHDTEVGAMNAWVALIGDAGSVYVPKGDPVRDPSSRQEDCIDGGCSFRALLRLAHSG